MKLSFRIFLYERIECGDLLMISFCTGGFCYQQHIYHQHANNPASYVGSLILWLKKLNWICSGNLCSHLWMALIMMLKLLMKLLQHQKFRTYSSIQGSYMFLTTTSIVVRQVLLPLVALSYYQLKKFCCNFRQIIHTDWDTPARFLSSCYPNHHEEILLWALFFGARCMNPASYVGIL